MEKKILSMSSAKECVTIRFMAGTPLHSYALYHYVADNVATKWRLGDVFARRPRDGSGIRDLDARWEDRKQDQNVR